MFSLLKRYRELVIVSALLLVPFGLFLSRGTTIRDPNFVDRAILWLTSPLQRGLGYLIDGVAEGWSGYVSLRGVKSQNDTLLGENAQLRGKLQALNEAELENRRLRALLELADAADGTEIAARVIGVNPVTTPLSLRLDRGSEDGVQKGAAVVTRDGVVGQVIRVTGGSSDVMLIKDPSSKTAVLVQRTRARATATGAGGDVNLILDYLPRTEDIAEGELLVTAGTDGVFPPGLAVGRATAIVKKTSGMFQAAEVVPAVDTTKLEEVLVLPLVHWNDRAQSATGLIAADGATDGGTREAAQ